jgi:general secretion pathway protein K
MATRKAAGGALLAVLWLSAALGAIAYSLASTVRAEIDRASTAVDGTRTYYLAQGAVERAILYLNWATKEPLLPDGTRRYYSPGDTVIPLMFQSGEARVEVIPEAAKLDINHSPPEDLLRLLAHLGVPPERAQAVVFGIVDWRTPAPDQKAPLFPAPSFRPHHASIEETEELLLIRGMTPELYYGGYDRNAEGRLIPRAGLADCVSVFGSVDAIDVNAAQPAVLGAIGLDPVAIAAIVERRRMMPFRNPGQLASFVQGAGRGAQRLRIGGKSIFTLRATARLRVGKDQFSDLRRTVAATVKFDSEPDVPPAQILRWYDSTWIN